MKHAAYTAAGQIANLQPADRLELATLVMKMLSPDERTAVLVAATEPPTDLEARWLHRAARHG